MRPMHGWVWHRKRAREVHVIVEYLLAVFKASTAPLEIPCHLVPVQLGTEAWITRK